MSESKDDKSTKDDGSTKDTEELRQNIARTRAEMSGTLGVLSEKLKDEVAGAKEVVKNELVEAKAAVKTEIAEAKEAVKSGLVEAKDAMKSGLVEAKDAVKGELIEAKDAFKDEVLEQYEHAKDVAYDATIGRVEHMARNATETVREAQTSFMDTIRANPIPAALAGVGIAWLLMNRKSSKQTASLGRGRMQFDGRVVDVYGNPMPGYYGQQPQRQNPAQRLVGRVQHAASDAVHQVGDTAGRVMSGARHEASHLADEAGNLAHRAQDQVGQLAGQAGQLAHDVSDQAGRVLHDVRDQAGNLVQGVQQQAGALVHGVQDGAGNLVHYAQDQATHLAQQAWSGARQAESKLESTYRSNPLAMGAVALAVGAAVGLALPRTDMEDELMGDARDQLMDRAGTMASQTLGKAQEAVEQLVTGETEQSNAKSGQGNQGVQRNQGNDDKQLASAKSGQSDDGKQQQADSKTASHSAAKTDGKTGGNNTASSSSRS